MHVQCRITTQEDGLFYNLKLLISKCTKNVTNVVIKEY